MSKRTFSVIFTCLLLISTFLIGCASDKPVTEMKTIATVNKGDLDIKVEASGYIEMPAAVNLYFDATMFTPLTVPELKRFTLRKATSLRPVLC